SYTYNSGPAAGLVGSYELGRELDVGGTGLTLDIGGTSTDIGSIGDSFAGVEEAITVDGITVDVPSIVAESLGGGGGSIARLEDGSVEVGPQSAGALPGPMCYGLGGEAPTVTDANLVLGYLDGDTFLGGRRSLDVEAATEGIRTQIADPLGISVPEAAWLIRQRVDEIVAAGLTRYAESRGLAPTAVFAYGGGGATHVSTVADLLGIPTAYCFPMSPVFSAYGSSRMDVSHLYETALIGANNGAGVDVGSLVAAMTEEAARDMLGEGFDPDLVQYQVEAGVSPAAAPSSRIFVAVGDASGSVPAAQVAQAAAAGLGDRGTDANGDDMVWESVRLRAVAATPHPELASPAYDGVYSPKAAGETRRVWTGSDFEDVAVHDLGDLATGDSVAGPAIIESEFTSIGVSGAREARIDGAGNVVLVTKD
ncbi:MAG: hydantoinase/oxoprolinase family protein, partial [Acidimicrobiales bacterium]